MATFLGNYPKRLDAKGRLSLPVQYRREASDAGFVMLQYQAPALTLFPKETWDRKRKRLERKRSLGPQAAARVRRVSSLAVEVSPDKLGRFLVPGWLQKKAKLDDDVLVVGNLDRIEVWNPGLFLAHIESLDDDGEDAAAFMYEVFDMADDDE